MNIKILDSWLREHLETEAKPAKIAEVLSLTSVSVEKIEEIGKDYLYEIEVTTNRPDLMSVIGLARETAVALLTEGVKAKFIERKKYTVKSSTQKFPVTIENDPKLVKRICAAVLSVKLDKSPQLIRDRLEASDIRSLNNVIDITNYIMRELGHPAHVFDLDRLTTKHLVIRESKKGEKIFTLDKKEHTLFGGEIVADNGEGEIVDLLGIMGTHNSVVTDGTQRVLLFVDNNDQHKIRRASMDLGIRSEAAVLNEKGVDPELAYDTLLRGIQLLEEVAGAKLESKVIDIYQHKSETKPIVISIEKINHVIGIEIPEKKVIEILEGLSFHIKKQGSMLTVTPPSARAQDITIPEDIIEEVARMYGYHRLPSILPPMPEVHPLHLSSNQFFWEKRVKNALKYWGFTEVFTSSIVSEDMLEVSLKDAVTLSNPLSNDMVALRTTLIPSLLQVVQENKSYESIRIFEMANTYIKRQKNLPLEVLTLSGILKKEGASFFEVKGIVEELFNDLGIIRYEFKKSESGGVGADIYTWGVKIGEIEVLDRNIIDFELNFDQIVKYALLKKTYTPLPKFPSAIENLRIAVSSDNEYATIVKTIQSASKLVRSVELLDTYENKKTFRIVYQSNEKSLTNQEIAEIREKIISVLKKHLHAEIS